jgi:hypothetical protein
LFAARQRKLVMPDAASYLRLGVFEAGPFVAGVRRRDALRTFGGSDEVIPASVVRMMASKS